MFYKEKEFKPKDERNAFLRNSLVDDAENMLQPIIKASGGTDFLVKFPEEFAGLTLDQEKAFLRANCDNKSGLTITYLVDGRITGNCQTSFRTGEGDHHRASVVVVLLQEFWNLRIGARIPEEMSQVAGERDNVRQIELDFIESNKRVRGLYKKMGFRIMGVKSDATRMEDGSSVNEYIMVKRL